MDTLYYVVVVVATSYSLYPGSCSCRPRNSAASLGLVQSELTVSWVGFAGQLNKCSVVCDDCKHSGHWSEFDAFIENRYD